MLIIEHPARDIPKREYFDNRTQEFITIEAKHLEPMCLRLEHSLMSIAKWESRWHKPFIGNDNLSGEEFQDYIRCMTVNEIKNPKVYDQITQEDLLRIVDYMQDQSSAWEINPKKKKKNSKKQKLEPVEKIYFAMIQYGVPIDICEKWHFNRLTALLDFCDSQGGSSPGGGSPKKRTEKEIMEMYRALNEKNRKKYNSKG